MVDVDCAVGDAPCLTAADGSGYEIDEAEVIYWGRCPECVGGSHGRTRTRERLGGIDVTEQRQRKREPSDPVPDPDADTRPRTNQDWWPNQLDLQVLHQHSPLANPLGEDFDYARGVQDARPRGAEAGHLRGDDDLAGLVAGRLRPLRAALHPDDVARRGHVPHRRRPRRRRPAAPSASPRSTAGPTTRASTRRAGCSGRSSRSTAARSPGPTCSSSPATVAMESMGFKTFGFGFGREDIWEPEEIFWGPEDTWLGDERYSGDRELAEPARRGADGPHLREPGGPERQPGSAGRRQGHPRDVRPHGDERRGDGRADRRRPHVRQDPRRRPARSTSARSPRPPRSSSRASAGRTASAAATAPTRITSGLEGAWTNEPTKWDNGFLDNLFEYDWELTESPAGAKQWTPEEPGGPGHGAGRARPVEAARADDADDRPRAEAGPDLRADREALLREPRRARRRVRQGVVQAAAPRHGARLALPRPVGAGAAAVAGPGPRGRSRADRRRRTSPPSRSRSSPRACRSRSWSPPPGRRRRSFRGTDKRGGANGARIRLAPQKDWEVNEPAELAKVLRGPRAGSSRSSTARRPAARRSRSPT